MTVDAASVVAGLPNPVTWAADKVAGFVDGVVGEGFEMVVGGLVAWVVDAVVWIVGGVFTFFFDATDPNVQADWFAGPDGPYAVTAGIGATLMVGFVLAGVVQGVLAGDVAGMCRRMALDLPMSVAAMVSLVTVTQVLVRLTDALSSDLLERFQDDVDDFIVVVTSLSSLGGGVASALVVFLLGLVTVLAGLALVAELTVRASLIYIVVALAPLVFAAQLWPALKGVGQKLIRLLCALILSKLAMAVALAVAAAAAVGAGSGGEVTALPEPEAAAEDPGGSVTQAVGILLAAGTSFGLGVFMPFLVSRLLPLAEDVAVAQGVAGGPLRAVQQGMSAAYYSQPLVRLASGARAAQPDQLPDMGYAPLPARLALPPAGPRAALPGAAPAGVLPPGPRPMPGGPAGHGGGQPAPDGDGGTPGTSTRAQPATGDDLVLGVGVDRTEPSSRGAVIDATAVEQAPAQPKKRGTVRPGGGASVAGRPVEGRPAGARRVPNYEDVPPPHGALTRRPTARPGGPGGRKERA